VLLLRYDCTTHLSTSYSSTARGSGGEGYHPAPYTVCFSRAHRSAWYLLFAVATKERLEDLWLKSTIEAQSTQAAQAASGAKGLDRSDGRRVTKSPAAVRALLPPPPPMAAVRDAGEGDDGGAAALAALDADAYLDRFHVRAYMQDALALLLVHRPEQPLPFLAEYYRRVRHGDNVRNREFRYVNSTPRNRLAYLTAFRRTYANLSERTDLSFLDYLELQRLLCPDFSSQFCEDVAKCLTTTGALSNALGFQPFLSMFQLLFYYSEFMMQAGEVYRKCMTTAAAGGGGGGSPKHGVVRSIAFLEAVRAYIYGSSAAGEGSGSYPKPAFEVVEAVLQQLTDAAAPEEEPAASPPSAGGAGSAAGDAAAAAAAAVGEPAESSSGRGADASTDGVVPSSSSSTFRRVPVVGGAPITFNDVCAALARRKEIAAVFIDDWRRSLRGPGYRGGGLELSGFGGEGPRVAGWTDSSSRRRGSGGSAREHGGGWVGGVRGGGDMVGVEGDIDRPDHSGGGGRGGGGGFGGFGRGGALPEGFGRPSPAGTPGGAGGAGAGGTAGGHGSAGRSSYGGGNAGAGSGSGLREGSDGGRGGSDSVAAPGGKKKTTTGRKKKIKKAKKSTPTS
jgi:hypothetical protein